MTLKTVCFLQKVFSFFKKLFFIIKRVQRDQVVKSENSLKFFCFNSAHFIFYLFLNLVAVKYYGSNGCFHYSKNLMNGHLWIANMTEFE